MRLLMMTGFLASLLVGAATGGSTPMSPCAVAAGAEKLAGKIIIVRGEAVTSDHDLLLVDNACGEVKIVLEYPEKPTVRPKADFQLRRDREFRRFERKLSAERRGGGYKSRVTATFTGRLDVSNGVGFIRDQADKVVGIEGFGHPFPFARFRLVIQSVSNVKASAYR